MINILFETYLIYIHLNFSERLCICVKTLITEKRLCTTGLYISIYIYITLYYIVYDIYIYIL